MTIKGENILALIAYYSKIKGYPQRSFIVNFCRDFDFNYNQWNAYVVEKQKIGIKPIFDIIKIFPHVNLNWLFKNEGEMFLDKTPTENSNIPDYLKEENKEINLEDIYKEIQHLRQVIEKQDF